MSKVNFETWVDNKLIDNLDDVEINTPFSTEVLTYDGAKWVNLPSSGGGGSSDKLLITRNVSEDVSALRLVIADDSSNVSLANNNSTYENSQVLGIATSGATTGNPITIVTNGVVNDISFTFLVNVPLFLGVNGSITDVAPTGSVNRTIIGKGQGAGQIYIEIGEPIILG